MTDLENHGPCAVIAGGSEGVDVRTLAVDLIDPAGVDRLFAATADLEIGLIYNAGANTCSEQFLDGDLADFARVLDLSIGAMMRLVQHYGRPMRDRRRGGLLLVGSMADYLGSVRHTVYGGVKASAGSSPKGSGSNCATTTSTSSNSSLG